MALLTVADNMYGSRKRGGGSRRGCPLFTNTIVITRLCQSKVGVVILHGWPFYTRIYGNQCRVINTKRWIVRDVPFQRVMLWFSKVWTCWGNLVLGFIHHGQTDIWHCIITPRVSHLERDVGQKRTLVEDIRNKLKVAQENARADANIMVGSMPYWIHFL